MCDKSHGDSVALSRSGMQDSCVLYVLMKVDDIYKQNATMQSHHIMKVDNDASISHSSDDLHHAL